MKFYVILSQSIFMFFNTAAIQCLLLGYF